MTVQYSRLTGNRISNVSEKTPIQHELTYFNCTQCELICTEKQNRKTEMSDAGDEVNVCCATCNESNNCVVSCKNA